jgi:hypothetical protein
VILLFIIQQFVIIKHKLPPSVNIVDYSGLGSEYDAF